MSGARVAGLGTTVVIMIMAAITSALADPFEKPKLLEDNIEFWKKIYAEVPLHQGLLHDYEYPLVIYGTYTVGELAGKERKAFLKTIRQPVLNALKAINTKARKKWSKEEVRIAKLFELHAEPGALKKAAARVRFQNGQKERFEEGLRRSGLYIDTIRSILKEFNVPARLAYLPHVESSFRPEVYSKVGAAGMWQFMAGTGRRFLKVNDYFDERLDPVFASRAAAELLAYNYAETQSWPLAITAYNYGLNGIKRAVRKLNTRDFTTILSKHESRTFKFSSKNFYACFIAACELAENPEPHFGKVDYYSPQEFNEIRLQHWIKADVLARHFGISIDQLHELNPALKRKVTTNGQALPKNSRLRIPAEISAEEAQYALERIPDTDKLERPPVTSYRVRRGDTLLGIASRFGVSTSKIAHINKLRRPDRIYVGQMLKIPSE